MVSFVYQTLDINEVSCSLPEKVSNKCMVVKKSI